MPKLDYTAFLACCRDERSLSHHTLRAYAQDLRTFARYVDGNDLADLFSRDDILGYHRYMRETVGFALQLRADGRPMWMQHNNRSTPGVTVPFSLAGSSNIVSFVLHIQGNM